MPPAAKSETPGEEIRTVRPGSDAIVVTTEERLRAIVRAEFEAVRAEHSTPRSDEPLLLTCSKLCKKLGV